MGNLTFLRSAFLAGAAVALVPIIIHLVQRRRVQRVVFGSVRFLRKMSQRVVRQRRLTELLLIILRTVAIAALAVAFARPFFTRHARRTRSGTTILGEEAALVMIDNSYSMMAGERMDKARQLALDYLDEVDPAVKVGVARFSSTFQMICPIGSSLARAREAIEKLPQSWEGTDLFLAMEQADRLLSTRPEQHRGIVVISDFQETSWRYAGAEKAKDTKGTSVQAARDRVDWRLKPGVGLIVKDVKETDPAKAAKRREELAKRAEATRKAAADARRAADMARQRATAAAAKASKDAGNKALKAAADEAARQAVQARTQADQAKSKADAAAEALRRPHAGAEFPNVYIERVAVPRIVVAGGFAEVISARIVNRTAKPLNNAQVVLRLAGKVVEKKAVNIRPNSGTPVRFRRIFKDPGDTVGSIHIEADDSLKKDNVAYFCVHVTPRVRVLLVNGEPNERLNRNDGFFIAKALDPGTPDVSSPFEVREVTPQKMTPADVKGVNGIIFSNVASLSQLNLAAVRKFIRDDGGGVAFFVGPKVVPETFNQSLGGIAPCQLFQLGRQAGDDPVTISVLEWRHEIFREFYGPRKGDFASARFAQYFQVKDSHAATILARFNNWRPALLEKRIGKGKSLLFVSAADLEWNNLCIKTIFPPFIHELTRRLCTERAAGDRNLIVGDRIAHRVGPEVKQVELRPPGGKTRTLPVVSLAGEAEEPEQPEGETPKAVEKMVSFPADEPGVYEMTFQGGQARFAVNLDPREPDTAPLDTKVLVASIRSDKIPPGVVVAGGGESVLSKSTPRERAESQQKLWIYLIALVLVVLAVEMVLAARTVTA